MSKKKRRRVNLQSAVKILLELRSENPQQNLPIKNLNEEIKMH